MINTRVLFTAKSILWIWIVLVVALNITPLGLSDRSVAQSLNSARVVNVRWDYAAHSATILCFAWIWLLGKIKRIRWFQRLESMKYSLMVLCIGIGLELIQILVPWRSFNPTDLVSNILGAVLVVIIVNLPIYRDT